MKNIIENVKIFLQMAFIGAILLYIATTVFMPEMTIKIFGFQPMIVVTESMEPVINVNDVVIATKFNSEEAQVGDIITFKADIDYNGTEEVVTHYIYSIDTSGEETIFRTNRHFEDADNVTPDTWLIQESNVIGSYSFHIQYLGLFIEFIKSVYGIAVIVVNIIVFGAIKYINNRQQMKEEQNQDQTLVNSPHTTI